MAGSEAKRDDKEIELKLAFEPGTASRIHAHPVLEQAPAATTSDLISTYYDTSCDALRKAGVFLRVRSTGKGYVQTIKTARSESEFLERDEWECTVPSDSPDLSAAEGTALAPLLTPEVTADLGPRCHTRIRRNIYRINRDGAEIEVAVDQGEAAAGTNTSPISEVELELANGDGREALFSLARSLSENAPLLLAVKSKAERGFELIDGKGEGAEKARPVTVTPDMTNAQSFRAIASNCLRQIVVNVPGIWDGQPDCVHQTRIGTRRMRAAIVLFGEMLAGPPCEAIKDKLRWIAKELGPARDLDVFAADILEPLRKANPNDEDIKAAYREFEQRHADAYARAIEAARSDRLRATLIDLAAWIEVGDWAQEASAQARVPDLAVEALAKLRRRIKKKGRDLADLPVEQRHALRIRAKRLRYATEFFAETFPGKKREKRRVASLAALEGMQEYLGDLNDIAVQRAILANGGDDVQFRFSRVDPKHEKAILRKAVRAYASFAGIKAFWKS